MDDKQVATDQMETSQQEVNENNAFTEITMLLFSREIFLDYSFRILNKKIFNTLF